MDKWHQKRNRPRGRAEQHTPQGAFDADKAANRTSPDTAGTSTEKPSTAAEDKLFSIAPSSGADVPFSRSFLFSRDLIVAMSLGQCARPVSSARLPEACYQ